jgi:hypothetical protein
MTPAAAFAEREERGGINGQTAEMQGVAMTELARSAEGRKHANGYSRGVAPYGAPRGGQRAHGRERKETHGDDETRG